ncbi:hypothetical protein OPU71_16775 [Niveibacterium sp. 24ML]|uniref:hypothetical protein n=1 Tax=Niveibacterium sp. 24ML TaxID=2985512 RepID=UPI00226D7B36|nr:hypothetical protein [Niveibacterium sp. 24ML]MCX9157780.1 hypothetical protein [Niveibacterium sp. 24ML]
MHTSPDPLDLRALAQDLVSLTGLQRAEAARRAGIHRPNLVRWFGNTGYVLALSKQLALCDALGWRYGALAREVMHQWWVLDDLAPLTRVLGLEATREEGHIAWLQVDGPERAGEVFALLHNRFQVTGVVRVCRPRSTSLPPTINAASTGLGRDLTERLTLSAEQAAKLTSDAVVPRHEALALIPESVLAELLEIPEAPESPPVIEDYVDDSEWIEEFDEGNGPPPDFAESISVAGVRDFDAATLDALFDAVSHWRPAHRNQWIALIRELALRGFHPAHAARMLGIRVRGESSETAP